MMAPEFRQHLLAGYEAGTRHVLSLPPNARGQIGNELGRGVGSSLEFMEHRDYMPGDDLRRIDWSVYARTDRLAVKQFREEVSPHTDILLDGSRSMHLEDTEKARAALGLVGFFAAASDTSGCTRCVWLASEGCQRLVNSNLSPALWEAIEFTSRTTLPESVHRMPPPWRARALRIVISDFLFLGEPRHVLMQLSAQAAGLIVVQLLARDDVQPPEHGNIRLRDSESDEEYEVFLDATARQRYKNNLARHQENWAQACRQRGAVFTVVVAEDVVDDWRLDDLLAAEYLRCA